MELTKNLGLKDLALTLLSKFRATSTDHFQIIDRAMVHEIFGQCLPSIDNLGLWLKDFPPWLGTSPFALNQHLKGPLIHSLTYSMMLTH